MDRIDEVRNRAELLRDAASIGLGAEKVVDFFEEDFPWLLSEAQRAGELEAKIWELEQYIADLEDEVQDRAG